MGDSAPQLITTRMVVSQDKAQNYKLLSFVVFPWFFSYMVKQHYSCTPGENYIPGNKILEFCTFFRVINKRYLSLKKFEFMEYILDDITAHIRLSINHVIK